MITRACNYCQESYQAEQRYINRGQGLFCSRRCSGLYKAANAPKLELNVACAYCYEPFHLSKSKLSKSKSGLVFCCKEHQTLAYQQGILAPGPKSTRTLTKCVQCDKKLQSAYELCADCELDLTIQSWLRGDNSVTIYDGETKSTKKFVKQHLIATRGDKCEVCGFNEKTSDGRSIIQMDHIDGNSNNNLIENLRLLCPNHHAMTPTYGSLNKGSGRAHRRKY